MNKDKNFFQRALLSIVEQRHIDDALSRLQNEDSVQFVTNGHLKGVIESIKQNEEPQIKEVFIKVKGKNEITYKARLLAVMECDKSQPDWDFKYEFRALMPIPPIPIESVKYYQTGASLRRDAQGIMVIKNIDIDMINDAAEAVLQKEDIPETEKTILSKSRIGQGKFRENVSGIEKVCRITGVDKIEYLRASHIKPWRDANNQERLDGENGLMLSPHVDHLFDRGYFTFTADGETILSSLCKEVWNIWGLPISKSKHQFSSKQKGYLAYHRQYIFLGE